jgi:DNA replication and repair protein RecF
MLSDLFLRDFRCFAQCALPLHPRCTLLIGRNAQGKTSLLEAACVLLRLQSPRTAQRSQWLRLGQSSLLLEGGFNGHRLRLGQSERLRRLAVDGAPCRLTADYLAASGRVVWMDFRDMNLLRGGSEHRRRYLDFAAAQLDAPYLRALRDYERALRSRNFALKRSAVIDWRQVDAFGEVMQDQADLLQRSRAALVDLLRPEVSAAHSDLSAGREQASLEYVPGSKPGSLATQLRELREQEAQTRQTALGPHRDELLLQINGLAADAFASEGQQRSLALALKVAQAKVLCDAQGRAPLLLLDDVFGELDEHRRRALMQLLPTDSQCIITTTQLEWMQQSQWPQSWTYRVEAAALERID